jgi:hypothetical protein
VTEDELKAMIAEFDLDQDGESASPTPGPRPPITHAFFTHYRLLVNEEEFVAIMTADY